jgi:hypothetical protein
MMRVPQKRKAWVLLVIATLATLYIREDGLAGRAAGSAILSIAYFKGRLVILDFMEMRCAPPVWRGLAEGWLLIVSLALGSVYLMSF